MTIDEQYLQKGSFVSHWLPGTKVQYAWDSSSLGYLKTCPRLYQYIMIEGWQPKGDSPHLRFGSEYHTALQEYDLYRAQDYTHDQALAQVLEDLLVRTADYKPDPLTKAGKYKSRELLVELVFYYLEMYRDDTTTTHILPSGKPAVELSFRFELPWGPSSGQEAKYVSDDMGEHYPTNQPYVLSGHLDRVVDWNGGLFVMDHKTTITTPGEYFFNQFDMSNQMTLYTLAASIVLETPIKGVVISAAQIKLEDHPAFLRGITYRTKDQLVEWQENLSQWLALAETYATEGFWPMNDTACDKFGGCKFRGVCSRSPSVRDVYLRSDFIQLEEIDRWSPLRSR